MARQSNISIDQGTTFTLTVEALDEDGEPLDLTGYTATAQIRKHYAAANSIDFTTEVGDTSILLTLDSTLTSNVDAGRYVYDVVITSDANVVSRIAEGICTITPMVTR